APMSAISNSRRRRPGTRSKADRMIRAIPFRRNGRGGGDRERVAARNRDVSIIHEMLALVEVNPHPRWRRVAHRGIVVRMKVDGVQEASWSNRSCLSGSGF